LEQLDSFNTLLNEKPDLALKYLYDNMYNKLCNKVMTLVKDTDVSEDIVQETIADIWQKRETIQIQQNFEAYIYRTCRNKALNYIRAQKIKWEDEESLSDYVSTLTKCDEAIEADELNEKIHQAIDELPEKCSIIFSLSRFENMSYNEIAEQLNISPKTVEGQISKALKILREKIYTFSEIK